MDNRQVVILSLDGNEFGICMDTVNSIERLSSICRCPGLPSFMEGLTEIRGKVHTIVNLRKRLGFPEKDIDEETRLIVLETCSSLIGFMADSVIEIRTVDSSDITKKVSRSKKTSVKIERKLVKGTLQLTDRAILLLEPESLVTEN